jgi:hypothetical protein
MKSLCIMQNGEWSASMIEVERPFIGLKQAVLIM